MFFRRRSDTPATRGQAMVEFAMVLPLLVLLLVMAIDFGRVFFGWVALQNSARIGADFAAQTRTSWAPATNPDALNNQADYQTLITSDLQAANCSFPTPHDPPTFTDMDSPPNGDNRDWGDHATVELTCEFGLITPLAENILGGPITLTAISSFAIHGIAVAGIPEAPPLPCEAPVASMTHDPPTTAGGRININGSDLEVTFTDTSPDTAACPILSRLWDFDGANPPETADEVTIDFPPHTGGGNTQYDVTLTIQTDLGSAVVDVTVRVTQ